MKKFLLFVVMLNSYAQNYKVNDILSIAHSAADFLIGRAYDSNLDGTLRTPSADSVDAVTALINNANDHAASNPIAVRSPEFYADFIAIVKTNANNADVNLKNIMNFANRKFDDDRTVDNVRAFARAFSCSDAVNSASVGFAANSIYVQNIAGSSAVNLLNLFLALDDFVSLHSLTNVTSDSAASLSDASNRVFNHYINFVYCLQDAAHVAACAVDNLDDSVAARNFYGHSDRNVFAVNFVQAVANASMRATSSAFDVIIKLCNDFINAKCYERPRVYSHNA